MKNENENLNENLIANAHELARRLACDVAGKPLPGESTARLVLILGVIYRLVVVSGAGVLVWHGGNPWLLVAAVPLLFFAPKPNR